MLNIKFINPLNGIDDVLTINNTIDYTFWRNVSDTSNAHIIEKLEYTLKCLDCSIIYDCGRNCILNSYLYNIHLGIYAFYVLKLQNQLLYNKYIQKLIDIHIANIIFEDEYKLKQLKTPKNIKKKYKNEFVKQVTKNLFDEEIIYEYVNFKTNEVIRSKNPDLLEELNKKKKKVKVNKQENIIQLSSMTFNFNKK